MRDSRDYFSDFLRLPALAADEERRAVFRQSMATLASAVDGQVSVPLEGLDPAALLASTRLALATGLVDELEFLDPASGAAALYELADSLPTGPEKRELGARIARRLHDGDMVTFLKLARLLALGSRRALSGRRQQARVALALDLPIGMGVPVDGLALALISRSETERDWLTAPSKGSLPSRRLAARLLERASGEAARRADQGDDSGLRVFRKPTVRDAWQRLLTDRESLVWRHVATARGLLAGVEPELRREIEHDLQPELSPTEWRRASTSLAAQVGARSRRAARRCRELLTGPILERDPGVAAAFVRGLAPGATTEPALVEELLALCVERGGLEVAEALLDLRRERIGDAFAAEACRHMSARLGELRQRTDDDGVHALAGALAADLDLDEGAGGSTLRARIDRALILFAQLGATAAQVEALGVVEAAEATLGTLQLCRDTDRAGRNHSLRALRELDQGVLETAALANLLALSGTGQTSELEKRLEALYAELSDWLLHREWDAPREPETHRTYYISRLRSLLHLIDADRGTGAAYDDERRARRLRSVRALLARARDDDPSSLRRVVCAAAARACDALVRDESVEVSDILVTAGIHRLTHDDLETLAEASMVPELVTALRALAELHRQADVATTSGASTRGCLDALTRLANDLPLASSGRMEALRATLLRLRQSLETLATQTSLGNALDASGGAVLAGVEDSITSLCQLVVGARRRMHLPVSEEPPASPTSIRLLDYAIERRASGATTHINEPLATVAESVADETLPALATVLTLVVGRLTQLPVQRVAGERVSFNATLPREAPLPGWLPPSRVIGGFFVLRSLARGAGGSVFEARRAEDRHKGHGDRFALKVPDYAGSAARTLSEAEFLRMFREEAGAMLAVPEHRNLARFVTFDAGAKPKPILVMELVDGPPLDREIDRGKMSVGQAIGIVDGIAAGLEAMHQVGVGHLDVKPGNVILADRPEHRAVLVDFGLSGRHIRPGCATGTYGAPEIWGLMPDGVTAASPTSADVYALGCVAYECLVGRPLFEAPTEMAMITAHVSHDGAPAPVRELAQGMGERLAMLLFGMLRRDPRDRVTVSSVRTELAGLRSELADAQWPLGAG